MSLPTDIVVILDRSGSMHTVRDEAIEGFNEFISSQQGQKDEANCTVILFDHEYEILHDRIPIDDVPFLDHSTFIPRGRTALYDAIGMTLSRFGAFSVSPKKDVAGMSVKEKLALLSSTEEETPKTLFAILTDGGENGSQEYKDSNAIVELLDVCRDAGWEFIFLSSDEKAVMTAQRDLNFSPHSTMVHDASHDGISKAYEGIATYTTSLRSGEHASTRGFSGSSAPSVSTISPEERTLKESSKGKKSTRKSKSTKE